MTIDHIDVMLCTMAFFLIVGILIPVFWILRPGQLKTIDSDGKCNIVRQWASIPEVLALIHAPFM